MFRYMFKLIECELGDNKSIFCIWYTSISRYTSIAYSSLAFNCLFLVFLIAIKNHIDRVMETISLHLHAIQFSRLSHLRKQSYYSYYDTNSRNNCMYTNNEQYSILSNTLSINEFLRSGTILPIGLSLMIYVRLQTCHIQQCHDQLASWMI